MSTMGAKASDVASKIVDCYREREEYESLEGLFCELIREAFTWNGVKLPQSNNLSEVNNMLATQLQVWREEWLAEGKAKGLAEGEEKGWAEGKAEGKAEALACLLEQRFGAVTPSWLERIRGAELARLDLWIRRVIAAPDVSSVFNPPS